MTILKNHLIIINLYNKMRKYIIKIKINHSKNNNSYNSNNNNIN